MQLSISGSETVKEMERAKNLNVRKKSKQVLDPGLLLRFNERQTEFMSLINSPAGKQLALSGQAISERSSATGLAHCDIYRVSLRGWVQICLYSLPREH